MGTWSNIEVASSRSHTVSDRWGEQRLTLQYVLRWVPANSSDSFPGEGHILDNLPVRPQQRLPSFFWTGGGVNDITKGYICRSVNVTPAREAAYVWNVTAEFTTTEFHYNDTPWGLAYVKQTRTSGIRQVAAWRDATLPANGTAAWPATADIGGTKIDLNGNPRSRKVKQQTIQIETFTDRTPPSPGTGSVAADPAWSTWLSTYINKRNNAAFLGWPIGTVLCQGIAATLDNEVWRITITYVYDEWFHLEQLAMPHPTGEPRLLPGVTIAGTQYMQAATVVWYQPYSSTADLKALFTQPIYDQFEKAGPTYP
jgi:hypothetical protein